MRELAVQATSEHTATDRTALDVEFEALKAGIQDINDDTQWNGTALLSGGSTFTFQVGANASQTIAVTIKDFDTTGDGDNQHLLVYLKTSILQLTYGDDSTEDLAALDIDASTTEASSSNKPDFQML